MTYGRTHVSGRPRTICRKKRFRRLDEFWTTRTLNRAHAALRRKRSWPAEWLEKLGESQSITYITPAEAEQLQNQFLTALRHYRYRSEDPSARPAGAMPIEYLVLSYPLMDLASMPVPATPAENSDDQELPS